ncbi:hypothetical protein TCAL_15208 [Tigriopus californicus]|uniref:Uncharacterized protein n=1 Tax=Tigriopus californicus TaxID=6832 RepID=A0A553NE99_TIGCA|nr:hypothetical protein TCAL_15208 [Tigriopus californicus]
MGGLVFENGVGDILDERRQILGQLPDGTQTSLLSANQGEDESMLIEVDHLKVLEFDGHQAVAPWSKRSHCSKAVLKLDNLISVIHPHKTGGVGVFCGSTYLATTFSTLLATFCSGGLTLSTKTPSTSLKAKLTKPWTVDNADAAGDADPQHHLTPAQANDTPPVGGKK